MHRDIKPANLLLDTEGVVWITDFGLAKGDEKGLTQSGDFLGTLRYMAPERFRGEGDARADVYALGLTLYELLTLRPGFESSDRLELIERIKTEEPVHPRLIDSRIPRDLETIVLKAIEKDPRARYQSVEAMGEDLRRFLADLPIRAAPGERVGAILALGEAEPGDRGAGWRARRGAGTRDGRLAAGGRLLQSGRSERAHGTARRGVVAAGGGIAAPRADVTLADMYTSRGLIAAERGVPAEAVLWFAAAADQSAMAEDAAREVNNRLAPGTGCARQCCPWRRHRRRRMSLSSIFSHGAICCSCGSGDERVMIWSWRDGKRLPWAGKLTGVLSAAFSPEGTSVALGFDSGMAEIRNAASGEVLATLEHQGPISAVAFSPDGKLVAIAGRTARVWDVTGKVFLGAVLGHPQQIGALVFNRKGNRLITACDDKLVRVFAVESVASGEAPLYKPVVHVTNESAPALVEDDHILVTASGEAELSALGRGDRPSGGETDPNLGVKPSWSR